MIAAPFRIVVLASGRGSNLRALIAARDRGALPIEIALVATDRPNAQALRIAQDAGIATLALDAKAEKDRAAFDRRLFDAVAARSPDLIVLAGFMRVLDAAVVRAWEGRLVNIHPSLLPAYRGLHTHARALSDGAHEHGASVHVVTAELDGGPVIAQARVAIAADDTPERLAERLLPIEHRLLVATVGAIARGEIRWRDGRLEAFGEPLARPLRLNDDDRLA